MYCPGKILLLEVYHTGPISPTGPKTKRGRRSALDIAGTDAGQLCRSSWSDLFSAQQHIGMFG
jgi:hypothetical protein